MATQKCPKCRSDRVRLGYRPTSLFLKIMFRYHLLCDACNWEFTGFAIPGTVAKKTKRKRVNEDVSQNKTRLNGDVKEFEKDYIDPKAEHEDPESENLETEYSPNSKTKLKKKVKVRLF